MADAFYIGMDLCSDFTQLSYYNDITREPESVSQLNNKETNPFIRTWYGQGDSIKDAVNNLKEVL